MLRSAEELAGLLLLGGFLGCMQRCYLVCMHVYVTWPINYILGCTKMQSRTTMMQYLAADWSILPVRGNRCHEHELLVHSLL